MQFKTTQKTYDIDFTGLIGGHYDDKMVGAFRLTTTYEGAPIVIEFAEDLILTVKGTLCLKCPQGSDLAKAAKSNAPVLYSLTPESVAWIRATAARAVADHVAEIAQIEVSRYRIGYGGDTHTLYLYPVGTDGRDISAHPDLKAIQKDVRDLLTSQDRKTLWAAGEEIECSSGLYVPGGWRAVPADLVTEVISARREKNAKIAAAKKADADAVYAEKLAEAQRTGKPVILKSRMVECDNRHESCDWDNEVTYICHDGTTRVTRYHTW